MLQDYFNPVRCSKVSSGYIVSSIDTGFIWTGRKNCDLRNKILVRSSGPYLARSAHVNSPTWGPSAPEPSRCSGWAVQNGCRQVSEPNPCTLNHLWGCAHARPSRMGGTCSEGGARGVFKASEWVWDVCMRVVWRRKQERNASCRCLLRLLVPARWALLSHSKTSTRGGFLASGFGFWLFL